MLDPGCTGKNGDYTAAGLVALFPFTTAEVAAARELRTAVLIWKVTGTAARRRQHPPCSRPRLRLVP
jgi:hypothetical protein